MKQPKNQQPDVNKQVDVSRSEHQQAQQLVNNTDNEARPEGARYKGNPKHHHSSHQEGQYQQQSDDPGMHPSDMDEEK